MSELDRLGELTIPAPQTGKPLQRLGVTAQLHLPGGHRPEPRRAALAVMQDVHGLATDEFHWWMGADDDRPRRIRAAFPADVRREVAPLVDQPDRMLSLALLQSENPPRWQAEAMMPAHEPSRSRLSRLTVSTPPSFALRDADRYVRSVLGWASALLPQHGTAGFALVDEIGMAHHRRGAAWPWLERYPGLDCDGFDVQPEPGRHVSVNWLTVLGDAVIASLGGLHVVRARLHDAAMERDVGSPAVLPYDGGALIRSSELPVLGDRAAGDVPAAYRAVNAALRPSRFEDYSEGPGIHLIDAPRALDRRQATLDWVRRFDD